MIHLVTIPVAVFSFLTGAYLGRRRQPLSMLPPDRSPLPGVPALAWARFVRVMAVSPRDYRSPRGRLGTFGLDARRLADVSFMTSPRKVRVGGEDGVWAGEWVSPLDEEKFLGSEEVQHEAFARSARRLAAKVAPLVGKTVDGKRSSLSGLIAVGHLAGEGGVAGWVADPAVRKKFTATTQSFTRANGIF